MMTRPGYGTKLDSVEVVHQEGKGACILSRLVRLDTLLLRCRCGCGSVCVQRQQTSTQGTTGWSPYLLIRIIARLSKVVFLLAILLFASTSHVVSALYSRFMPHAKRACASQFYGSRRCDWDHGRAQLWMARPAFRKVVAHPLSFSSFRPHHLIEYCSYLEFEGCGGGFLFSLFSCV